ncbi:hypothetical protein [Geopseudomonas aromaticivorans]
MKKLPELKSHEVLGEAQGLIYDLAGKVLDYLEPSEAQAQKVARALGVDLVFDCGVVYVSNPSLDVYASIDGHDFDRQAFRPAFKALVGKVQCGEAEVECSLDIAIEPLGDDTAKLSSSAMRCEYPVKLGNLEGSVAELSREWGGQRLAMGDGGIIKVARELNDPAGLLAREADMGLSGQAPGV